MRVVVGNQFDVLITVEDERVGISNRVSVRALPTGVALGPDHCIIWKYRVGSLMVFKLRSVRRRSRGSTADCVPNEAQIVLDRAARSVCISRSPRRRTGIDTFHA